MEEAHRQRLGAGGQRPLERALHARHLEGHQDGAVGRQALDHLEAVLALDHGLGPHERRHEERGDVPLGTPDLDQVAEAGGGEQGHPRAPALEDGVGAYRRAVHEPPHVATGDAEGVQTRDDRRGLVTRPRGNLGDDDLSGVDVHRAEVGERASDIDPDDEHARMIALPP